MAIGFNESRSKGKVIHRGKFASVHELKNKYFIYTKGYATPIETHMNRTTAINKAKALDKEHDSLAWWDKE